MKHLQEYNIPIGMMKNLDNSIINKKIFLSEAQNKEDLKNGKNDEEFKKKKFYKYNDGSDEKFKKKIMMSSKIEDDDKIKEKKENKINKNKEIYNKNENIEINNIDKINTIKNN